MKVLAGQTQEWQTYNGPQLGVHVYGYPLLGGSWVTARRMADLYSQQGCSMVKDLDGEFAVILEDRAKHKNYVLTSRFGMFALCYTKEGDEVTVAAEVERLMPEKPKLNLMKVLEYLSWGYGTTAMTVGDTTYVEGVRRFRPASITDVNSGETECYWNPFVQPRREYPADFDTFRDRFHEYMAEIVKTGDPMITTITGGLDTRTILAGYLAVRNGRNTMRAFTHVGNEADTELARQICRHYGIPHTLYKPCDLNGFVESGDLLEGLVPGLSYRPMTECVEREAQKGTGTLMVGLCGNEVWRGRLHLRVIEEYQHRPPAETLINALCTSIYFPTLPPVYGVDADTMMLDRTREVLQAAPAFALDHPYYLTDWFIWQHAAPNWAGTLVRSMAKHFKVSCIMLSKDLVETMYGMSMDIRRNGEHQRHIIGHASTFLGKTKYDVSPQQIRAKNVLLGAVRPIVRNRVTAAMLRQAKVRGVVEDKYARLVADMLDWDSMRTRDLFDRPRLEAYVKSNINPPWVERLVSLEMWLRKVRI